MKKLISDVEGVIPFFNSENKKFQTLFLLKLDESIFEQEEEEGEEDCFSSETSPSQVPFPK